HLVGVGDLFGHELSASQRGCAGEHIEGERECQQLRLAEIDASVQIRAQVLLGQTLLNLVEVLRTVGQQVLRRPVRMQLIEHRTQRWEVARNPSSQPGTGLDVECLVNRPTASQVQSEARREVEAVDVLQ